VRTLIARWRRVILALGFATGCLVLSIGATTPAAAYPIQQEPAGQCNLPGWSAVINFGPLAGFCGQDSGNPATSCPPGYFQTSFTCAFGLGGTVVQIAQLASKLKNAAIMAQVDKIMTGAPGLRTPDQINEVDWDDMAEQLLEMNGKISEDQGLAALRALGPSHLGMYVSPSPSFGEIGGGAGVVSTRGFGVTDSTGVLAPGSMTPSATNTYGSGGIKGSYDASRLFGLPANQGLSFRGFFDYARNTGSFGVITGLVAPSAGSVQGDQYTFGGSFLYNINMTYLKGSAAVGFGSAHETDSVDGSTGNFTTRGYAVDLRLGNVLVLLDSSGSKSSLPTKAPPRPAGGNIVALDLSGHIGYGDGWNNGFTDSSGFVFGTSQTQFGDIGGRAKLFAVIPANGLLWMPYVAGTVDQLFGYSNTFTIPDQPALPGGDLLSLTQAQTFWGTELGVSVRGAGWTGGIKGFYQASADTNAVGGAVYLKIPFNYTATVAARY
jgi:hypothetical protein